MTVVAHVGGLPLEELLPALAGGSSGLLLVRAWLTSTLTVRRPDRHTLVCNGAMLRRYLPLAVAILVFLVGAVVAYLIGAELLL